MEKSDYMIKLVHRRIEVVVVVKTVIIMQCIINLISCNEVFVIHVQCFLMYMMLLLNFNINVILFVHTNYLLLIKCIIIDVNKYNTMY